LKTIEDISDFGMSQRLLQDTVANRGRWPSKLNDYIAIGRPTVACPVGDIAFLFKQHKIGILAKNEPEAFANAVMELLGNPSARAEMGAKARTVAENILSWGMLTNELETFYNKIKG